MDVPIVEAFREAHPGDLGFGVASASSVVAGRILDASIAVGRFALCGLIGSLPLTLVVAGMVRSVSPFAEGIGCLADLRPDGLAVRRVLGVACVPVGDRAVDLVDVGLAGLAWAVAGGARVVRAGRVIAGPVTVGVLASLGFEARQFGWTRAARPMGPIDGSTGLWRLVGAGDVTALAARHVVAGALFEAAHLGVAWLARAIAMGTGGVAVRLAAGWLVGTAGALVA